MIDGVLLTPLSIINTLEGDIFHAMKKSDDGFFGFGEAYFSQVKPNKVKAWKRHKKMTLNLIVPIGEIRFVLFDDRKNKKKQFQEIILSKNNYFRLTIPSMIWVGFQGISKYNSMLLNIADIVHDPNETDNKNIEEIKFNWSD